MDALALTEQLDGERYVGVRRGGVLESVHRVAACAVDARGRTILSMGSIDVPVYLRSTAKPFIAAAAVRQGVVERFGLEPREIALMAASHNGEPFHVEAAESILRKIGLPDSALLCGPHPPYDPASAQALARAGIAYSAIHNNCSGKHAGILALCRTIGADTTSYLDAANPAQREILALCARACGVSVEDFELGIDGCGIPVFAVSLRHAALAFSRLATLEGLDERDERALRVVRDAMTAYPQYVAGTGEFDTALMRAAGARVAVKSGAEGVLGLADAGRGVGLALKVVDGAARAVPAATMALLGTLGALEPKETLELAPFEQTTLYNRAGTRVGSIAPLDPDGANAP